MLSTTNAISFIFRSRASAGDLSAGPTSFPRLFHSSLSLPTTSAVVEIGGAAAIRAGGNEWMKVKAKERKWSRNREGYMVDNGEPLPLPMTYPDSSPVSPEVIDERLQCDPKLEVLSFVIEILVA